MKQQMHTFAALITALVVAVVPQSIAYAEVIAHESFDYDVGDLDGNAGGVGFGDEWIVTSEFSVEVVEPANPLSYTLPGGATINGGDRAMRFGNDDDELVLGDEGEAVLRDLAEPFEGDELFFSFLYRYDEGGFIDNNDFVVWWLESRDGPQMGIKGNGGDGSTPDDFTGRVNGQFAPPQQAIVEGHDISDEEGTLGIDYFLVGKASREGNTDNEGDYDEFAIWVNPSANEAGDPHAVAFGDPVANGDDGGRFLTEFVERMGLRIFNQEPGDAMFWDELRLGTTWEDVTSAVGDAGGGTGDFDGDGVLTASDIDALSAAILAGDTAARFDLDGDGNVSDADRSVWVESFAKTWFGDANFDGEFNSGDLVATFTKGQYEDTIDGNSGWADGDWNGDGDFNSSDFVTAFTGGGYENGPRAATAAVPEPTSIFPFVLLATGWMSRFRQRT